MFAGACWPAVFAFGSEVYHDDTLDVRWDNTLSYTTAFRLFPRSPELISNPNWDDGDRNFAQGPISNRFDLLSQFEASTADFGVRLSAQAWYDSIYHQRNDNDSPATFNPYSVPHDEFPSDVRDLQGSDIRLGDAFVHGATEFGGMPVSFRLGRYVLLWGESVFFADNSIAAGQAPSDINRQVAEPGSYTHENFLPVWQASLALQLFENVSLSAYYQFAWRKDVLPGAGSYFSYLDFEDAGGERIILAPGQYLYRARDMRPPDTAQFGVALQVGGGDIDYGFYALQFNAKEPELYAYFGVGSKGEGVYRLVYPGGIELYGASFSTYLADSGVAGELSFRRNMPLVSTPQLVWPGMLADNRGHPLYAVGNTLHGQLSSQTAFAGTSFWERAELNVELAANDRLSIRTNPEALDPYADRFAMAFHANFTPQYFQVLPGLDLSLPVGFGYGLAGNSSIDETQTARVGNLEIGVAATYRAVWQASVSFTHFIGRPERQPLADRDFLAFTVQRTF